MHSIKGLVVYQIPDAKCIKLEKFGARKVKYRFLEYEWTSYCLLNNNKVIILSDGTFVEEKSIIKEEIIVDNNLSGNTFWDK